MDRKTCNLCQRTRLALPTGVTICTTCDLTPTSSLPNGHLLRRFGDAR